MRVAFVYVSFGLPVMSPAISYLMTMAQKEGHDVLLVDPTFHIGDWKRYSLEKINRFKPDVVCYSGTNYIFEKSIEIAKLIKKNFSNAKQIWGGHHATFSPDTVIRFKEVDALFRGEAENQFIEYLKNLDNTQYLKKLDGLWFKDEEGNVWKNMAVPVTEDLDSLPNIDYGYWDVEKYLNFGVSFPGSLMHFASYGCPFTCTFCNFAGLNKLTKNKHYRLKSPEKTISEIKENYEKYHDKGFNVVDFSDPIFGLNKKHFMKLTDLYIKEGLNEKLPFICQTRAEVITEDVAKRLSEAGCFCVSMGLESADDDIRMKLYDKRIKKETFEKAIDNLNNYNIKYGIYYIYDGPGENFKSIKRGVKYARELNPMYIEIPRYWPLIGTTLYNKSKDMMKHKDKRKVPMIKRDRNSFEEIQISLYYIFFKYYMMLEKIFRSIAIKKIRFFTDILKTIADKKSRTVLIKYPIYFFQFYLHLVTYFRYNLEEWKKKRAIPE